MRTIIALSLLLASLVAIHAAGETNISGNIDGKKLELAPDIQTKVIEITTKLLATCGNISAQPKNTIRNARRQSHLELVFTPPRKFDLAP